MKVRHVSVIIELITYLLASGTNEFQCSCVSVVNELKIDKMILHCTFYV